MTRHRATFATMLAMLTAWMAVTHVQEAPPPPHDSAADLRARHPEVEANDAFRSWRTLAQVGSWYETPLDAQRRRTVIVQDTAGDRVFAAQVLTPDSGRPTAAVRHTASVDLNERRQTRKEALTLLGDRVPVGRVQRTRPVVEFREDGSWQFSWQFQVEAGPKVEIYRLRDKALQLEGVRDGLVPAPPVPPEADAGPGRAAASFGGMPTSDEFLASNELHHAQQFTAEAQAWVAHLLTSQERARRIYEQVSDTYSYDDGIPQIRNFTWSDLLTRDMNGRAGICDEFSVVAVTYLRAVGIPARLKLLSWKENGAAKAHQALEYFDGTTWRHLDALWGFNDPTIYRAKGMSEVRVMDADQPRDARFTGDAYGKPDVPGDGRLHPYFDFVLAPPYPGSARSGYSY